MSELDVGEGRGQTAARMTWIALGCPGRRSRVTGPACRVRAGSSGPRDARMSSSPCATCPGVGLLRAARVAARLVPGGRRPPHAGGWGRAPAQGPRATRRRVQRPAAVASRRCSGTSACWPEEAVASAPRWRAVLDRQADTCLWWGVADVFKALADPTRRAILDELTSATARPCSRSARGWHEHGLGLVPPGGLPAPRRTGVGRPGRPPTRGPLQVPRPGHRAAATDRDPMAGTDERAHGEQT